MKNNQISKIRRPGNGMSLLFAAFLGMVICWSCTKDNPNEEPLVAIMVKTPGNNERIDLNAQEKLLFEWSSNTEIDAYTLALSLTEDFAVEHSFAADGKSLELWMEDVNEIVRKSAGETVPLYWMVKSNETDKEPVKSDVKTIQVVPDRTGYIKLREDRISGMELLKGEGNYQYAIQTTSADPYVYAWGLEEAVDANTYMLSFQYTSEQPFNFQVFFMKEGVPESQQNSFTQVIPSSEGAWKEFSISFKIPIDAGWGQPADWMRFDWGSESGLFLGVKKIHFRGLRADEEPGEVIPGNPYFIRLGHGYIPPYVTYSVPAPPNHFKVHNTEGNTNADTYIWTHPVLEDDARTKTVLRFQYKSNSGLANFRIMFHHGVLGWGNPQLVDTGELPPATEWKEWSLDLADYIDNPNYNWRAVGGDPRLRFGFMQAVFDVEIRNIFFREP